MQDEPDTFLPVDDVVSRFEAQVALTPNATAVVFGDVSLSFARLNQQINRLARYLIDLGAGPEQVVAVALPRSEQSVVAALAVWKAGAVYLPIDPYYPADRIAFMLADTAPAIALTTSTSLPTVDRPGIRSLLLDDPATKRVLSTLATTNVEPAERTADPNGRHAAYIIYTSGSTGKPKGVLVERRSLANLIRPFGPDSPYFASALKAFGGRPLRLSHLFSWSFDGSFAPFMWMIQGNELHVIDDAVRLDPAALLAYLRQHAMDHLDVTPTQAMSLFRLGLGDVYRDRPLLLILGGEELPETLWRDIGQQRTIKAFNVYGPTEGTLDITVARLGGEHVSIGRPIPNTGAWVLDQQLKPAPPGVWGELYIDGAGLARGYLNQAGLTAERFVANPFGPPGARMYRTGDIARRDASGAFDFLGRADGQVKIRGFRIELGEIEAAMREVPGVSQVAVMAVTDQEGAPSLVGYVVPDRTTDCLSTKELRVHLAARLPRYMVPTTLVIRDDLPQNINGKLDREALRLLAAEAIDVVEIPAHDGGHADSREQVLRKLFAEELDRPDVAAADRFFELGGDSVGAMRLVARARHAGLVIAVSDVFQQQTPEALAKVATELGGTTATVVADKDDVPLDSLSQPEIDFLQTAWRTTEDRPEIAEILPLSPLQQGLLLHSIHENSNDYLIQLVVHLEGPVDVVTLRAAADSLAHRHPALRTALWHEGVSQPVQVVAVPATPTWRTVAVSGSTDEVRERNAEQILAEERSNQFDLTKPPLIRYAIVRLEPERYRLVVTVHHIILDGWSTTLLLKELFEHYTAGGRADKHPAVVPYRDYFAWLARQSREDAETAWRAALDGVTEPTRIDALPEAAHQRAETAFTIVLSAETTVSLVEMARAVGVTLNTVVQGAWALTLSRSLDRDDVVFGMTTAFRPAEIADIEQVIGALINTTPVRVRLDACETLADYLRRFQAEQTSLLPHRHLSLTATQRPTGIEELFDTLVVFDNYEAADSLKVTDDLYVPVIEMHHAPHYALTLIVTMREQLTLQFLAKPELIGAAAKAVSNRLVRLLDRWSDGRGS